MNKPLHLRLEHLTRLLEENQPVDAPVRPLIRFPEGGAPAERALATVWFSKTHLHALAVMEDTHVSNTAKGRHEKTWETGDVMELFIQPDVRKKNYFEFHVTPSGAALSLRIPDAEKLRADEYAFEELLFDSVFEYDNGTFGGPVSGWWAHAALPLSEIELTDPRQARCCVCRYNYNPAWDGPECSSTAKLTGYTSFHTLERWHGVDGGVSP